MDETKQKIDWQRLAITVGIVLVTAAAVGGTVWYLMDQNAKSIDDSNTKSIVSLQKQVDELKASKPSKTAPETKETDTTSDWKTYTNSETGISFKYPSNYTLTDKTSSWIGSDANQFPWHSRSDFAKAVFMLDGEGNNDIQVKIVESTDMDKVLNSMGGTSPNKTVAKYGAFSGYIATQYGQGYESSDIMYTLVGSKYSVAVSAPNPSYSTTLSDMVKTIKF